VEVSANDNGFKLAYSVEEAAKALSVGRTTIFDLLKSGALRRVKIGAKTVIPRSSLVSLLGEAQDAA
jgi:excisionase family DNA binding protein